MRLIAIESIGNSEAKGSGSLSNFGSSMNFPWGTPLDSQVDTSSGPRGNSEIRSSRSLSGGLQRNMLMASDSFQCEA